MKLRSTEVCAAGPNCSSFTKTVRLWSGLKPRRENADAVLTNILHVLTEREPHNKRRDGSTCREWKKSAQSLEAMAQPAFGLDARASGFFWQVEG